MHGEEEFRMEQNKSLIAGSSVLMLLSLLETRDYYGYEIIREIERRSGGSFRFKEGTLYPILHKMESNSLIRAYRKTAENGKERRYYSLTGEGRRQLDKERAGWQSFTHAVGKVIGEGMGNGGTCASV